MRVELLTNRTGAADRRRIADGLRAGAVDVVVGTHALIYEGVEFSRLGLAVIDEQHRFGVEQRDLLRGKGDEPDVLVMTATPIPRTVAMLIYGDLDKSELRELPAGRTPIVTEVVGTGPLERQGVYERVRAEVAAGRQAYVVCPLVEGSTKLEARAATDEYERLAAEDLAGLRLGLLHGQMPSADKEAVMRAFRDHELDVLVATTVIEVGVDVPNATVMVVEDADRFGLLQLHQLRGRIGRGEHASHCFLLAEPATPDGRARLEAMVESSDGFELAERDLEIRGAGEVFGERQSGWTDLKLGRLHATRGSWSRREAWRSGSSTPTPTWSATRSCARRSRTCSATRSSSCSRAERSHVPRRGLRVIAGTAGGLPLVAPRGGQSRPTTDRVKESVFAALGPDRLEDVAVLDLYAGSGALAIEALSRGARRALLVDRDRLAVDACRRNLTSTRFDDRARVQGSTVDAFLRPGHPTRRRSASCSSIRPTRPRRTRWRGC